MTVARSVLIAFTVLGCAASVAPAQDARPPSRGDLAVYAGGSWTSSWLEAAGQRFGIGSNPIFGGFGHLWVTPHIGARLHLGYMPSDLPRPEDAELVPIPDNRMHNWFYDLSLAVRPFAGQDRPTALTSFYLFAGGGALSPNGEGGEAGQCVEPYVHGDACLPYGWREATVGQVTAGLGTTAITIGPSLGVFVEGGVHGYSSPFRMGEAWTGRPPCVNPDCLADRRGGRTVRLVGGFILAMGPRLAPPAVPLPPPPPAPPVVPPEERPLTLCVVLDGFPRYVDVIVRPTDGDTLVVTEQGIRRPLRAAYPATPPTASGRDWFEREEPVFLTGREYVRFGVPRELSQDQVSRVGEFRGVPVFASADDRLDALPTTVFLPIQDGCIFQPFQMRERVRVRG